MVLPVKRQTLVLVLALLSLSLVTVGCTKISTSSSKTNSNLQVVDKPQPGQVAVLDSNILVNAPLSNQKIFSPVKITGRVKTTDQTLVFIRVRDDQNYVLATSTIQLTQDPSGWGSYEISLDYDQPTAPTGAVDVWLGNPTVASSPDLLSLPVGFADFKNPVVKLYYSNIIKDPNLLDCSSVYPIEREVAYSKNILAAALDALFHNLTESEIKQGFVSNFSEEQVVLQDMQLATTTGTLTLDFNPAFQKGVAGSCRVTAIRAQIEQTMKQFGGIEKVVITVDGDAKGILQP